MNNWNNTVVEISPTIGADFGWGGFLKKAFHSVTHVASQGLGVIGKVPVVGGALHAVYDSSIAGPLSLASNIAKGQRIDHAAVGALKANINAAREIAPYVQSVVTLVPGVGQGIGGAIGAASALAGGKNITEAMAEAVKGAMPGGPLAKAAFEIAQAGIQGKPIDQVAIAALPLGDAEKKAVLSSVQAARDIAHGKNVAKSVYEHGKGLLPPEAQTALQTGIALGHAKNLQDLAKAGAAAAGPSLAKLGAAKIMESPVLKSGLSALKDAQAQTGFKVGSGLMGRAFTHQELTAIRGTLTPEAKKGFDLAAAAHIGAAKAPIKSGSPAYRFGWYAAHGIEGAKDKNKLALKVTLAANNDMIQGSIAHRSAADGFLARVKQAIRGFVRS